MSEIVNLNFRIPESEKWAFKEFCAKHRMSQVEALRSGNALLRAVKKIEPKTDLEVFAGLIEGIDEIFIDRDHAISLQRRGWIGARLWAVSVMGKTVLTKEGEQVYEPSPSSQDKDFINATWFTLGDAVAVAKAYRDRVLAEEDL